VRELSIGGPATKNTPLKYRGLFNSASVALIKKVDIAGPCGFECEPALRNINITRPEIRIFETSAKTGEGVGEWLAWLAEQAEPARTGFARSSGVPFWHLPLPAP
jgi:hydrogenase nickel incorporation protein HypB